MYQILELIKLWSISAKSILTGFDNEEIKVFKQ